MLKIIAYCCCIQDSYVRHQKDMDALQFRLSKLQQEFEAQLNVCDQLNTENQNRALDLKVFYHSLYQSESFGSRDIK